MDWKARITASLQRVARQRADQIDDDVLEELAQHAASTYASARAEGRDEPDAERRVMQQIAAWSADPALLRRRPKRAPAIAPPAASAGRFTSIVQDVRYAWRLLGRQPLYAALVVATMALGIAATTTIGSVAYGVLLKPLPWADAPRLVRLYETRQGSTRRFNPMMTNATFLAWRESPSSTLDAIEAWSGRQAVIGEDEQPERMQIAGVTAGLLDVVGATPQLGRLFNPADAQPGRPRVAILSYGLWQQRFGGAADVVGRTLRIGGTSHEIIGVTPASFVFPDRATRAWVPFNVRPMVTPGTPGANVQMFQALGHLRPNVSADQAAADGTARGRAVPAVKAPIMMAVFGSDGPVDVSAVPMLQAATREVRPALVILFIAVLLLLATATANAASLQLARASARRRELAIRTALGAGRGRLVRQTLIENLLLGLLGGAAGLVLAALMHRILPALLPADFPRVDDLAFDWRIQTFAVFVSVVAGLGCGLLPALHAARGSVAHALVEDSLAPVGGGVRTGTARARAAIMALQVAIASVLLIGAVLLIRSFTAMMHANVGYDGANVLSARLILADRLFSEERRLQVVQDVLDRISRAGVVRAAAATALPFTGSEILGSFPVKKRDGSVVQVQTSERQVTAGYFAALGQRILEGRGFTAEDGTSAQKVAIVNREFSRKYLDGRALGWTLPGDKAAIPIVGVVDDTVRNSVGDAAHPDVYFPMTQRPLYASDIHLVIRTAEDPVAIVPTLRSIARETAPAAPLESIMTMEDRVSASLAKPRLYAVLLGTFAAFALAIAGVGLFGVLSYTVAQRAREIGVRSALGAQVRDIVALVLRQSMTIAAAGLVAGLTASLWLTSALQGYLFGVTPHDAASFGAVAIVLLVVAALASVVPARRAARVDPVRVLRG